MHVLLLLMIKAFIDPPFPVEKRATE